MKGKLSHGQIVVLSRFPNRWVSVVLETSSNSVLSAKILVVVLGLWFGLFDELPTQLFILFSDF
jgi:hypothetical protein